MQRRVAITGMGLVTAAGSDLDQVWSALIRGTCFIRPLTTFSCLDLGELRGAELFLAAADDLPRWIDTDDGRARTMRLALAAARRAWKDAAVSAAPTPRDDTGIVVGTTMAEERQVSDLSERVAQTGPDAVDAGFVLRANNHRLAAVLATELGLAGPAILNTTACSSGIAATAWAYDLVSSGAVPRMMAGGADTFTRLIFAGFQRMGALSKSICRPFDRRRDGVSFGEGAAFLVLEDLEQARARGAHVHAEILGYGMSNDAHHMTAPDPNGAGFARAMQQALDTTNIGVDQIDYISAHGTGTPYNDVGEVRAVKSVFGARAGQIPISSIKSMIGHTNGAAGAIESIACALALTRQQIPPTANLTEPDPECDLDCVPEHGRTVQVETCLNLGAGFGGFNVCLVLKRASA